ncbi:MAG: zf-HC2 domain-containing protein [Candidatus Brocadiaceae bacterium]|jgi:anti-sigma factor RsiW
MAECTYRKRLMAYHDGELTPERRRELEEHLKDCPACAAELEELRTLSGVLGEAEAPTMPEGMVERLRGAVPAARERTIVRLCRAVSLAAAVLLVVCGGWVWYETAEGRAALAAPPAWEVAAVTLDNDVAGAGPGETFALWAVNDLSRENGR